MTDLRGRPADEVLDFYRQLVEPTEGYVGYSEPTLKQTVLDTVSELPGTNVVDLGCGPNPVVLFELAERGRRIAAVDLSPQFCESARRNGERRGIELRVESASIDRTRFADDEFDVAILSETLEHVPDELEQPAIREAFRIIRPGGYLVISVPNARSLFERYQNWRAGAPIEHPQHLREYTHERVRRLLDWSGFEIDRALRVPATDQPVARAKAAWTIDRIALRPEWSLKVAFVARKPDGAR